MTNKNLTKEEKELIILCLERDIECNCDTVLDSENYKCDERLAWTQENLNLLKIIQKLK